MKYTMIYEIENANGERVTESYTGDEYQIKQAINIARVHDYRIKEIIEIEAAE